MTHRTRRTHRRREVSAREVGDLALHAIERLNPILNCVLQTYPERVAPWGAPPPSGVLAGVPTLLKDIYKFEKGALSECGSLLTKGLVGWYDSEGGSAASSRRTRDSGPLHGTRTRLGEHLRHSPCRIDRGILGISTPIRRIEQRCGRGGRGRHRTHCPRQRRRRIHARAGCIYRPRRSEAHSRPCERRARKCGSKRRHVRPSRRDPYRARYRPRCSTRSRARPREILIRRRYPSARSSRRSVERHGR